MNLLKRIVGVVKTATVITATSTQAGAATVTAPPKPVVIGHVQAPLPAVTVPIEAPRSLKPQPRKSLDELEMPRSIPKSREIREVADRIIERTMSLSEQNSERGQARRLREINMAWEQWDAGEGWLSRQRKPVTLRGRCRNRVRLSDSNPHKFMPWLGCLFTQKDWERPKWVDESARRFIMCRTYALGVGTGQMLVSWLPEQGSVLRIEDLVLPTVMNFVGKDALCDLYPTWVNVDHRRKYGVVEITVSSQMGAAVRLHLLENFDQPVLRRAKDPEQNWRNKDVATENATATAWQKLEDVKLTWQGRQNFERALQLFTHVHLHWRDENRELRHVHNNAEQFKNTLKL